MATAAVNPRLIAPAPTIDDNRRRHARGPDRALRAVASTGPGVTATTLRRRARPTTARGRRARPLARRHACGSSESDPDPAAGHADSATTASLSDATDDLAEAPTEPAPGEPGGSETIEPATWEGELVATDPPFTDLAEPLDGFVAIERLADGTFTLSGYVEYRAESDDCQDIVLRTSEMAGEYEPSLGRIDFEGTSSVETTCMTPPLSSTGVTDQTVEVDGSTLRGLCCGGVAFEVTGPEVIPAD